MDPPPVDARPVPIGPEQRAVMLQPEDIAAAVKFLVDSNRRALNP
jgi:hypothetical protein